MRITFIFCLLGLFCLNSPVMAVDYQEIMGQRQIIFEQVAQGLSTEKNSEIRIYSAREESTNATFYQFRNWLENLTFQGKTLNKLMQEDADLQAVVRRNLFLDFRLEEFLYPEGQVKTTLIRTWNGTELARVLDRLYREINFTPNLNFPNSFDSTELPNYAENYHDYTGVIIDTRGYQVKPSMAPKIIDIMRTEVYGTMDCDLQFVIESGIVGYAYSLEEAKKNQRIGTNPYIIKAVGRHGNAKDHAIIPLVEADFLRKMNEESTILVECKVMFIIDD